MDGPVTIVGAGIAGLTAALCLVRAGFEVEILERAPRLEEAGAGLQLSPNALRVLAALGLLEPLRAAGVSAEAVTLRAGRSGRRLATIPVRAADGTPYLSLLRTDLQAVLLAAVTADPRIHLRLGAPLAGIGRSAAGDFDLTIADADGGPARPLRRRIVVGADGVRSAVAAIASSPGAEASAPVASGLSAWRMMLDEPSPTGGIEAWLGHGLHAVAYPVAGGRRINLVAIGPDAGSVATPIDRHALLHRFAGWDPRLLDRFGRAGALGVWPLLTADRMDRDPPEGLFLIGDAAHAMLPFAAQGAAMAIEDAAVLAASLAGSASLRDASRRYLDARRPRLAAVRRRVGFHRFVYHLPRPLAWGRDLALALRSDDALRRDLAWLYDWTPPPL